MTRNAFQTQLATLNQELQNMGALVRSAIHGAVGALATRDVEAAKRVIEGDEAVNAAYAKIERLCLELLALQQPMAVDLRRITSTLKVITDLERMADHAVDIAETVVRLGGAPLIKPLVHIPQMAQLAEEMVADALNCFVSNDKQAALAMIEKDHQVDRLFREVIGDLELLMQHESRTVPQGIQLLFVARSLERIGDHATNLGEWLIYLLTGERTELNQ